jgi:hypothetical protein
MRSTSKSIGSGVAGFVALAAFASNASAQLQGPNQGSPQVQSESAKPSPLRDFQQMIETQRSQMQSRVAAAAERIQSACRTELQNFCSTVTPGEGRLLLCMQAHEDKLGNQCQLALFEASRNIQQAARRVERVADACWSDIQTHCGGGSSIVQCMNDRCCPRLARQRLLNFAPRLSRLHHRSSSNALSQACPYTAPMA